MGKHSQQRMSGLDEKGRLERANKRVEEERAERAKQSVLVAKALIQAMKEHAKERAERAAARADPRTWVH